MNDVNDEVVSDIMQHLSIATDDPDVKNNIKMKAIAVLSYLKNAGYNAENNAENNNDILNNELIACISIGVNDLLNNKAGDTKFSPAFKMLAMQLCV